MAGTRRRKSPLGLDPLPLLWSHIKEEEESGGLEEEIWSGTKTIMSTDSQITINMQVIELIDKKRSCKFANNTSSLETCYVLLGIGSKGDKIL